MKIDIPVAQRIASLPQEPVSSLAENAHMALVVCLLAATLFRRYILEWIFPRIPSLNFTQLDDRKQKSFLNACMHLIVRVVALCSVVPAFIQILAGHANFASTFTKDGPTFGTMLMAAMILMCSIYIHEIIYREHMSFITLVHHVGTVCIGAYAILLSLEWETKDYTQAYFAICLCFGFFDVLTEFWITLSFVICTMYENRPRIRYQVCAAAAGLQVLGILVELPLILVIFYSRSLRQRWPLSFKVITPLTYVTFLLAQMACVKAFVGMALKYRKQWLQGENTGLSFRTSSEGTVVEGGGHKEKIWVEVRRTDV